MDRLNPVYRPAAATKARYRILVGGAGSGKSVFAAQDHIKRAASDGRRRILALRKTAKACRHSTFQVLLDVIADLGRTSQVKVNQTEMSITFPSGGRIFHAGLDDVEKLKSIAGITDIWAEEASELKYVTNEGGMRQHDFDQIDLRLRGPNAFQITLTYNPVYAAKWTFDRFGLSLGEFPEYRGYAERGNVFVQHTTIDDNEWVGDEYLQVFDRLSDSIRDVYKLGRFAMIDSPDQLIQYEWIKRAMQTEPDGGPQQMGIDVARFGDDKTAFAYMRGNELYEYEAFEGFDITRTSSIAATRIQDRKISADSVGVDVVGLGAGVADNLRDAGLQVQDIVSGGASVDIPEYETYRFKNLRSQMWWHMRELLRNGQMAITCKDTQPLIEDLIAPRYRMGSDKVIEVESKDKIKQRLGRSPDIGDAVVYSAFVKHIDTSFSFIYESPWA